MNINIYYFKFGKQPSKKLKLVKVVLGLIANTFEPNLSSFLNELKLGFTITLIYY